jgi:prolyl oligopeptidase
VSSRVRCLGLSGIIALVPVLAAGAPPVAQIRPVTDRYGATRLVDNYRWMESQPNPELRAYVAAETASADAAISRIPGRDKLARTIAALDLPGVAVPTVVEDGGTIFYLRRGPNDDVARLYVRDTGSRSPRVLVDPETLPDARPHSEIGAIAPSPDGLYVAYTLADSGPDSSVLRIQDVARAITLNERIPGARFAAVAWQNDSHGFYYTRPVAEPDGDDTGATQAVAGSPWRHLGVYLHRIGTKPARDTLVLDAAHLPFPFHGQHVIPRLLLSPGSDYALAIVTDGVSPEIAVYAVPTSQLALQPAPWAAIAPQGGGVTQISVSGSLAFMLTNANAPTFRVVSEDLADPGIDQTRTILPASPDGVITGIAAASDALYVARRQGVGMHLLRLNYQEPRPEDLRLPYAGTIAPAFGFDNSAGLVADPRNPGALFTLESWIRPRTWLRFDSHLHRVVDAGLVPAPATDFSAYQSIESFATARDGTKIPLSLITRQDIVLDHARPTLIEAYGSYGYAYDPRFLPTALAWVDQGGVYAIAHIRGGGELGPPWHAAGQFANKRNSVTDLLTCADAITTRGYANAAHLAVVAAAVLPSPPAAITWQPAAFRAALLRDGLLNPLRTDPAANPEAAQEFGTPRDPTQFNDLLPIDAYSQMREGVEYPAVLLTAHAADSQVPSWQSAKMAARLSAATPAGRPVLLRVTATTPQGRAARAAADADELGFLLWQLGTPGFQPTGRPADRAPADAPKVVDPSRRRSEFPG